MNNQRKRHTPGQIVRKLGQADRLLAEAELEKAALKELSEGNFQARTDAVP